jgi:hypothetical protein
LVHQARAVKTATWPEGKDYTYLNKLRNLANNIADATLYQGVRGNSAAAIELARDELHMAGIVTEKPSKSVVGFLVVDVFMAQVSNRLMLIAPGLNLTKDENDKGDLNVKAARELIAELLDQRDVKQQMIEVLGPEGSPGWKDPNVQTDRLKATMERANAELTYAAMSLACQLYRFEKGSWPASLEQLVPNDLPRAPIDPGGDGKQTFG